MSNEELDMFSDERDVVWYLGWYQTIDKQWKLGFAKYINKDTMAMTVSVATVIEKDDKCNWFIYNGWDYKGTSDTLFEACLEVEDYIKKTPFNKALIVEKKMKV